MTTAAISLALVAFLLVAVRLGRGVRLVEYASYRGKAGRHHILFSLLSSLIGGWAFFGLAAVGFEAGVVGYIMGLVSLVGLALLGWLAPRLREAMATHHCDTLDDYIGARYGPATQAVSTVINVVVFLAVLATQFVAMAGLVSFALSSESDVVLYGGAAVVIFYTAQAGFKGVVFTDIWQLWMVGAGAILMFAVLASHFGVSSLQALPPEHFTGLGYGPVLLIGLVLFITPSFLVRTDLWQRVASSRDPTELRHAFLLCGPILLVFYVLLTTAGMFGRIAVGPAGRPDTSALVALGFALEGRDDLLAGVLLAVFVVTVLAALLSTIDTNLNLVAVSVVKLLRRRQWIQFEAETEDKVSGARTDPERRLLTTTRAATVVLGILGFLLARLLPDIVDLIVGAAGILLVLLPASLGALLRGRGAAGPALASMAAGFATFVASLGFMAGKTAFVPGVIVSFLVYGVVHYGRGQMGGR